MTKCGCTVTISKYWVPSANLTAFFRSEGPYSHDLALIRLRRKVLMSPEVSPVCLPQKEVKYKDGLKCVISGWGKTSGKS